MKEQIVDGYKEMLITGDGEINSFTLSKKVGISEKEFFEQFSSVEEVGRYIWLSLGENVIETLNGSESFNSFPPRQKILSYFFTFFEDAVNERTFISRTIDDSNLLTAYKERFKTFVGDLVQEGIAVEDIKERLSLSNYYPNVLWELHVRLIRFWLKDSSEHFTETEKAVEIYSKVPLELMGPNLLDSVFQTLKFDFSRLNFDRVFNLVGKK
jgi:hypothetical protein